MEQRDRVAGISLRAFYGRVPEDVECEFELPKADLRANVSLANRRTGELGVQIAEYQELWSTTYAFPDQSIELGITCSGEIHLLEVNLLVHYGNAPLYPISGLEILLFCWLPPPPTRRRVFP